LKITAAFGSNSSARRKWRLGGGGGEGTAPGVELFMEEPPGAIVSHRKNFESTGDFGDTKVLLSIDNFIVLK
jgi:hypothetical protein